MNTWKLIHCRIVYLLAAVFAASLLLPGCGGSEPPPDGQLQIENVAKWYSLYRAEHRGKPPADEAAFIEFVNERLSERGETVDTETLLTSPRDGKPFVVQYGKPTSPNPEQNVAVREAEGYDGKKLVAFELGYAEALDETQLEQALAGELFDAG